MVERAGFHQHPVEHPAQTACDERAGDHRRGQIDACAQHAPAGIRDPVVDAAAESRQCS